MGEKGTNLNLNKDRDIVADVVFYIVVAGKIYLCGSTLWLKDSSNCKADAEGKLVRTRSLEGKLAWNTLQALWASNP